MGREPKPPIAGESAEVAPNMLGVLGVNDIGFEAAVGKEAAWQNMISSVVRQHTIILSCPLKPSQKTTTCHVTKHVQRRVLRASWGEGVIRCNLERVLGRGWPI